MNEKEQKILLANLLNDEYGISNVRCKENKQVNGNGEVSFEWSNITTNTIIEYRDLYEALRNYRGHTEFVKVNRIKYDYVINGTNIVIEYDENQHFTTLRKMTFDYYPNDIILNYDRELWKARCERLNMHDNNPPCRDEQRAFRDAIRDIASFRNGYKLVRIYHGEYDFSKQEDKDRFLSRLRSL